MKTPAVSSIKSTAINRISLTATNWLFNHEQLLHIVSRAKALLPHCCVILGGPEFLGDNEAFLYKNKFVSGVFRGEGEEVFPLWLKVWNQPRKEWKSITGLCYLDESEAYHTMARPCHELFRISSS